MSATIRPRSPPTASGSPPRSGWASDGVVWMNQVHGDRVAVVDGPVNGRGRQNRRIGHHHAAIGFGGGNRRLCSGFNGRRPRGSGRGRSRGPGRRAEGCRRPDGGGDAATSGAHAEDISVLLGPAVSGRNYEVPAEMAAEVEAALPGSRTTTVAGHARTGSAGRNRQAANGFGHHGHRRRPALHGRRPQPVQPSARCPDRTAGVVGVDGMTEHVASARERRTGRRACRRSGAPRARRGGRRTQSRRN